jgi:hypothetical protein
MSQPGTLLHDSGILLSGIIFHGSGIISGCDKISFKFFIAKSKVCCTDHFDLPSIPAISLISYVSHLRFRSLLGIQYFKEKTLACDLVCGVLLSCSKACVIFSLEYLINISEIGLLALSFSIYTLYSSLISQSGVNIVANFFLALSKRLLTDSVFINNPLSRNFSTISSSVRSIPIPSGFIQPGFNQNFRTHTKAYLYSISLSECNRSSKSLFISVCSVTRESGDDIPLY